MNNGDILRWHSAVWIMRGEPKVNEAMVEAVNADMIAAGYGPFMPVTIEHLFRYWAAPKRRQQLRETVNRMVCSD